MKGKFFLTKVRCKPERAINPFGFQSTTDLLQSVTGLVQVEVDQSSGSWKFLHRNSKSCSSRRLSSSRIGGSPVTRRGIRHCRRKCNAGLRVMASPVARDKRIPVESCSSNEDYRRAARLDKCELQLPWPASNKFDGQARCLLRPADWDARSLPAFPRDTFPLRLGPLGSKITSLAQSRPDVF